MSAPRYIPNRHGPRPRYPLGNGWTDFERAMNIERLDNMIRREQIRDDFYALPIEIRERIRDHYPVELGGGNLRRREVYRKWRADQRIQELRRQEGRPVYYGPGY